jgi:arginyl-tRNA synthetase
MTFTDKKAIAAILHKHIKHLNIDEIENLIEIPPENIEFEYSFPCFRIAKQEKIPPNVVAENLKSEIKAPAFIESIECSGPYLNFHIKPKILLSNIFRLKEDFGRMRDSSKKKRLKYVIEYPSPNTNKPLHLGHIRNMLLGCSISNLLKYKGHEVFQVNLNNDRGIHICRSMLAYKKLGNNQEPDKKSDHYVGDYYVKYISLAKQNPSIENEARDLLRQWEEGDESTLKLWRKMNKWALDGFKETYEKLGISFDKEYFESQIYEKGKKIVMDGLKKGIFSKTEDGAIVAPLKQDHDLKDKVLIRSDGTSIYITQDIYLAYLKKMDFDYDKSIYVVGDEQIDHFKKLFAILNILGFKADNYHLAYGLIYLPEGRMKSREGTVVDADDLIKEVENLALKEVEKRYPELGNAEKQSRATIIAMAALKFFILKFSPPKGFIFNPEESISFEGETGPYIQYCYARIESILKKSSLVLDVNINWNLLNHYKELAIIKQLNYFPEVLDAIEKSYGLHLIPQYLLTLCQAFNSFYSTCQVISEDKVLEKARLMLIFCVQIVILTGLNLLGIDTLDQM